MIQLKAGSQKLREIRKEFERDAPIFWDRNGKKKVYTIKILRKKSGDNNL